jgi:hypothetical protein
MYSRETINELNALSKSVFGSSSKWKKMIDKGVPELVEEEIKKLIFKDGKEAYEMVKIPTYFTGKFGNVEMAHYKLNRYTVESVKDFMLMVLERRAQVQATIKRLEEEQRAKKEALDKASGSAV